MEIVWGKKKVEGWLSKGEVWGFHRRWPGCSPGDALLPGLSCMNHPAGSQVDKHQEEDRTCKWGKRGRKKYIKFVPPSGGSQCHPQCWQFPVGKGHPHSLSHATTPALTVFTFLHLTPFPAPLPHFILSFTLRIFFKDILQSDFYYILSQKGEMS